MDESIIFTLYETCPGSDYPLPSHQPYYSCADRNNRNHLSYLHRHAINV